MLVPTAAGTCVWNQSFIQVPTSNNFDTYVTLRLSQGLLNTHHASKGSSSALSNFLRQPQQVLGNSDVTMKHPSSLTYAFGEYIPLLLGAWWASNEPTLNVMCIREYCWRLLF